MQKFKLFCVWLSVGLLSVLKIRSTQTHIRTYHTKRDATYVIMSA